MFRGLGLVLVIAAIGLAACGRQLTGLGAPDAGSIQAGHMLIRLRVAGPLDFTNVEYLIVFNTTGTGAEPYPAALTTNLQNYSFALVIGGNRTTSSPILDQYYLAPGTSSGLLTYQLIIPPQLVNYVPNSGGNPSGGGEFTINFDRALLYGQNLSGSPTPNPTPAASAAPTTAPPTAPSASPTLNPNVAPTTLPQHVWAINFITANPNSSPPNIPLDSMGLGGPTDTTSPPFTVDTTQAVDRVYMKPVGTGSVSNPSAQLQGFEIINAP